MSKQDFESVKVQMEEDLEKYYSKIGNCETRDARS